MLDKERKDKSFREKWSGAIVVGLFVLIALAALVNREVFEPMAWIAFGLLGLDVIWVGTQAGRKALASKSWPITHGTLIKAYGDYRRYQGTVKKYFLEIEYEYSVSGTNFTGTNFNWVGLVKDKQEQIDAVIAELDKYGSLTIHYNPKDPAESVIKPMLSPIHLLGGAVGLVMVALAILGFTGNIQWLAQYLG